MVMGKQVRMAAIFQRQQMKNVRLVPVVLSLVLVTACIQEAKWTWHFFAGTFQGASEYYVDLVFHVSQ